MSIAVRLPSNTTSPGSRSSSNTRPLRSGGTITRTGGSSSSRRWPISPAGLDIDNLRHDVRRLQAHQVVFTPVPLRIGGKTIRVPEPGTFQLVPDAAGVGEPGLPHLQRPIVTQDRKS